MCINVVPYGKCTTPKCPTRVKWQYQAEFKQCQLSKDGESCETTEQPKNVPFICSTCQQPEDEDAEGEYEYGPAPLPNPSK
ncbi:hypothetical protein Forpe1208_v015044 [Fusarium oxysporum f. sp. rapae]|uniref:Uncharacterized protein n=1 Tax=Fusarium oxysporum f. sp. rapae TaxID=485398 RepID=A0A8J5TPU7_FUSOX|nr:hypothetical protein Forpe1208_v015044 [Fusarium oxysporum f. sp. rapae]